MCIDPVNKINIYYLKQSKHERKNDGYTEEEQSQEHLVQISLLSRIQY